jgi:eukaryotic translation initiation factor 2C
MRSYNIGPLLSALNIILAKYPSGLGNGVRVGRDRYFFKSGESLNLGGGLEAWKVSSAYINSSAFDSPI